MKLITLVDVMELIGLGTLTAGAWLQFGAGWGLLVFGAVLLGYSIVSRRAGVGK